jgi:hypothetical protein
MEGAMSGNVLSRSSSGGHNARNSEAPPQMSCLVDWHGPTLREFVRQIEHEFGRGVDISSLRHAGIGHDESLDPAEIRQLCELLGLPPEDFGVA